MFREVAISKRGRTCFSSVSSRRHRRRRRRDINPGGLWPSRISRAPPLFAIERLVLTDECALRYSDDADDTDAAVDDADVAAATTADGDDYDHDDDDMHLYRLQIAVLIIRRSFDTPSDPARNRIRISSTHRYRAYVVIPLIPRIHTYTYTQTQVARISRSNAPQRFDLRQRDVNGVARIAKSQTTSRRIVIRRLTEDGFVYGFHGTVRHF